MRLQERSLTWLEQHTSPVSVSWLFRLSVLTFRHINWLAACFLTDARFLAARSLFVWLRLFTCLFFLPSLIGPLWVWLVLIAKIIFAPTWILPLGSEAQHRLARWWSDNLWDGLDWMVILPSIAIFLVARIFPIWLVKTLRCLFHLFLSLLVFNNLSFSFFYSFFEFVWFLLLAVLQFLLCAFAIGWSFKLLWRITSFFRWLFFIVRIAKQA